MSNVLNKDLLNKLLLGLIENGGSDMILSAGKPITFRINGQITFINGMPIFNRSDVIELLKILLRSRFNEFVENKNIDFSYKLNEDYSFRGNAFFQIDGPAIVFRVIPNRVPSLDELNMPEVVKKFSDLERGLVLVTGITGSGKSTTLAAIINEINKKYSKHIITLEDPVEFKHKSLKSIINQRTIGEDAKSYKDGLKAALREDPDIILVGEMRDRETMEIAIEAAETGHLVFSTLHTLNVPETINRILTSFPSDEHNRLLNVLSEVLRGIISQRLIKRKDGNGRVALMEVLVQTPRIKKAIKEGLTGKIYELLEEGRELYGTQTFEQHLVDLVISGEVDEEEARKFATNINKFELLLSKKKTELGETKFDENLIKNLKLK